MYAYTYVYACEELLKKRGVMHASGASVSHITCGESYSVALMSGVWVFVCVCMYGAVYVRLHTIMPTHVHTPIQHTITPTPDGSLWSWGMCSFGSLGHGPTVTSLPKPKKMTGQASRFVSVVSGTHHVVARCSNFDFYVWGSNQRGQLGVAKEKDSSHEKIMSPRKMQLMVVGQVRQDLKLKP
jgi:hypothetical protein